MIKLLLVVSLLSALWLTRPGAAIEDCERVNTRAVCEILNKE